MIPSGGGKRRRVDGGKKKKSSAEQPEVTTGATVQESSPVAEASSSGQQQQQQQQQQSPHRQQSQQRGAGSSTTTTSAPAEAADDPPSSASSRPRFSKRAEANAAAATAVVAAAVAPDPSIPSFVADSLSTSTSNSRASGSKSGSKRQATVENCPGTGAADDAPNNGISSSSSSSSTAGSGEESVRTSLEKIMQHYKCPITQQLLVDPVVAEDGHIYERYALESWLCRKKTSPTTNEPMGMVMLRSMAAQQTINDLVEQGVPDTDTLVNFFLDRGRFRCTRTSGSGPDLAGATSDFTLALESAQTPAQATLARFQLKVALWMKEGAKVFSEIEALCREPGEELATWLVEYGIGAKAAVTAALLESRRMTEWKELQIGTRVYVIEDTNELQRLCERPPPEADEDVGWNDEMASFAGKVCFVQRMGEESQKDYVLQREHGPIGRPFSFPYTALYLLGNV